jgi:membrane protease YdiL (CAAX protease family)
MAACVAGLAGRLPDLYEDLVRALVFALLIAAALYLASRVLDHRRMSDYGFHFSRKWWTDLGFGLVLGALLLFGVLAVELAVGWVHVTGSFAPSPGQPFVATILVGVVAVAGRSFRGGGVVSRIPDQEPGRGRRQARWGMVIAVVIPAVFFGLAHATNENATWLSTFNIVIFGLLFGTGYVLTGELALPIGLHFGWDFVQGFVFGVVAEGKQYGSVLVLADDSSATLWTGQPYGAEGGLMGTAAFIAWLPGNIRVGAISAPRSPVGHPSASRQLTPPDADRRYDIFPGETAITLTWRTRWPGRTASRSDPGDRRRLGVKERLRMLLRE